MKNSLSHLPPPKREEFARVVNCICEQVAETQMILLFGSYARGDWKDGPHEQGRGRLTIHKKSDYDILVVVTHEHTARKISLWDDLKKQLATLNLSAIVRLLPRDIDFVNYQLSQCQYFFTEICGQGITLYDSGKFTLSDPKPLNPDKEKELAQNTLDDIFKSATDFYRQHEHALNDQAYKISAFDLHQATEHSYKTVLLIFGGECPQEHHLDVLGDLAADYCPQLKGILPRESEAERELFELLDYAYIGARYDRNYKITKEQLEQLAPYVKTLHETTEKICKEKIESFV